MKLQSLLAAMLYCRADQLPFSYDLGKIPGWFINDYLKFMLSSPTLFFEKGEADNYFRFMHEWVSYLHNNIFANPESKFWQEIGWAFTHNANFIPLYFNTANLKDIYSKRADIIEFVLKVRGAQIDYVFPKPSSERRKIRIGILTKHFGPMTETFSTLPYFEYLDRSQFDIFLYASNLNGNPLEQYCQSRADKLIQLPNDLPTQVHAIRSDNLDILLIATNVSAVTHPITLLATHRLARIQIATFNSPMTTGIRSIDYYIAGSFMEPEPEGQTHYREKLACIEGAGACFSYTFEPYTPTIQAARNNFGIPEQAVVFISSANFFKLIPELREIWAKIMAGVPNAVLVLMPFGPSWTNSYPAESFIRNMHAVFEKYAVNANRLKVLPSFPSRADVKEVLKLGDIYLDSYPYAGTTSLVDPLEVGVPAIAWEGKTLRSRMGGAVLRAISVPDLIVNNEASYIQLATELGKNSQLRRQYRDQIARNMANNPPFLDSRTFSAKIGNLFKQLFEEYQSMTAISSPKPVLSPEFLNLLIGCANLYDIDPSNASMVSQLRTIRRQLADFWINTPADQLKNVYQGELLRGQRAILGSGFKKEPLNPDEGLFLQQVIAELNQKAAANPADALNYLLAAMLYLLPDKLKIGNAQNTLPGWLIGDYEKFFSSSSESL